MREPAPEEVGGEEGGGDAVGGLPAVAEQPGARAMRGPPKGLASVATQTDEMAELASIIDGGGSLDDRLGTDEPTEHARPPLELISLDGKSPSASPRPGRHLKEESFEKSFHSKKRVSRRSGAGSRREREAKAAPMEQKLVVWNIQHLYDDKVKRDALDKQVGRRRQPLKFVLADFFLQRFGIREVAEKHLNQFKTGVLNATAVSVRLRLFAALAGLGTRRRPRGHSRRPAALTWFLELEKKSNKASVAIEAHGAAEAEASEASLWLPLTDAIKILQSEFKFAGRATCRTWSPSSSAAVVEEECAERAIRAATSPERGQGSDVRPGFSRISDGGNSPERPW